VLWPPGFAHFSATARLKNNRSRWSRLGFAALVSLLAVAAFGLSCRSGPPPAIDPGLAAHLPATATILAGVNLERVRESPLYRQLPPAAVALMGSLSSARTLLAAADGARYLVLARGEFREAPAGGTLLAQGLAGIGSPDWLDEARHGKSKNGLLARAEPLARSADIWMAAAGSANLPVSGNGENLNRLLHATEYATLSVRLTDSVALEVIGMCSGSGPAAHLEETIRAFAGIGAGAAARDPALSSLLRRIRITREGTAVHVSLTVEAAELQTVLKLFGVG
jgi:hypothetical protein